MFKIPETCRVLRSCLPRLSVTRDCATKNRLAPGPIRNSQLASANAREQLELMISRPDNHTSNNNIAAITRAYESRISFASPPSLPSHWHFRGSSAFAADRGRATNINKEVPSCHTRDPLMRPPPGAPQPWPTAAFPSASPRTCS